MLRFIKRHSEYQEFLKAPYVHRSQNFIVPVLSGSDAEFGLGITISRKIGKAVVRNLLKRRIKAWLHQYPEPFPLGIRINLIARAGAGKLGWQTLTLELKQIIQTLAPGKSPAK